MSKISVNVVNLSPNPLPTYAKPGDAGMDIRADFSRGINESFMFGCSWDSEREVLLMFSGGRCLVPTGLFTSIPTGFEVQIRPRSGSALKQGLTILNSPGTIDSGYRNEWGVILMNLSDDVVEISQGDRIAQAVLKPVDTIEWNIVDDVNNLPPSERGATGFGDSGIK